MYKVEKIEELIENRIGAPTTVNTGRQGIPVTVIFTYTPSGSAQVAWNLFLRELKRDENTKVKQKSKGAQTLYEICFEDKGPTEVLKLMEEFVPTDSGGGQGSTTRLRHAWGITARNANVANPKDSTHGMFDETEPI